MRVSRRGNTTVHDVSCYCQLLCYVFFVARRNVGKGLGPKDDWGGYGSKQSYKNAIKSGQVKMEEGSIQGVKAAVTRAAVKVIKSPVGAPLRRAITSVGDDVAERLVSSGKAAASKGGKVVKVAKKADVYTPQGVYKGAQVFIKKPQLTPGQIRGIEKAAATRQAKEFSRLAQAGRYGAAIGGGAGVVGTLGAQKAINTAKDVLSQPKKSSKPRSGGGAKKR